MQVTISGSPESSEKPKKKVMILTPLDNALEKEFNEANALFLMLKSSHFFIPGTI